MKQLLMTGLRARLDHSELAAAMLRGDVLAVVRLGTLAMEDTAAPLSGRAVAGQLVARACLEMGREEESEEVSQRLLHVYDGLPREQARWLTALDSGCLNLSQRRFAAAAQQFNAVADDAASPVALRVEALVGLATAINSLGERRRSDHSLILALRLAATLNDSLSMRLLDAARLDLEASSHLLNFDNAGEVTASPNPARARSLPLCAELRAAAERLPDVPLYAQRLHMLGLLLAPELADSAHTESARTQVRATLHVLRSAQLHRMEEDARIDAALACAAAGQHALVREWLSAVITDETQLHRHRAAPELMRCVSILHSHQGRHAEALRLYRCYAQEVVYKLRRELPQLPELRFLEGIAETVQSDATELQLPARYRKAYRFIIDNLGDRMLTITHVAAHVDVTVRALQAAFRLHLSMTPAELIRRRRVEAIRAELLHNTGRENIHDVAERWGMPSRSTLRQNYRLRFGEAPSKALRQGAVSAS